MMQSDSFDVMPEALKSVHCEPLFVMRLDVLPLLIPGATPAGYRRVGIVPGGSFGGGRLSGVVLAGGSDWQIVRSDGTTLLDVRLVLETTDKALICMTYRGIRHGPSEVIKRLEQGEPVEPSSYYFRINPMFETTAHRYDWLNRCIAVGIGHRLAQGPIYSVFEIL